MTSKNLNFNSYKEQITQNLKDKYPYLLTGLVVVLLIFTFIWKTTGKNISVSKNSLEVQKSESVREISKETIVEQAVVKTNTQTYIVKRGDHLWKIAEEAYGSGYNAYDIAKANKLENPSMIYEGQKLAIPSVEPKLLTRGEISSAKTTRVINKIDKYVVQTGDNLWDIAVSVYGDGFAWRRIAKVNNLENPGLIFKGQVLKIE